MTTRIMIVAGEASGDLHGSRLVRAIRSSLHEDLEASGIGGSELEASGVELLFRSSEIAVVGFLEVLSHLKPIVAAQKIMRRRLLEQRPDLLILVDFPDFNMLLARKAKKLGIPVFYYISPQVWAWRSGRVRTIGRLTDAIGVILPFEEEFYRERGVTAHYVGHPLLDSVRSTMNRTTFCNTFAIDDARRLIGILPGSRSREIRHLLPVFLEAASLFARRSADRPIFLLPQAPTISEAELRDNGISDYQSKIDIRIIPTNRYEMMAACDAVIAASGTVALELLLLDTPAVVAYKLAPLTYQLGRMLVRIPFFSLVNLIAEKELVPELLQHEACPERICEELQRLVYDRSVRETLKEGYRRVRQTLGDAGASERAARLALTLIGRDLPSIHHER